LCPRLEAAAQGLTPSAHLKSLVERLNKRAVDAVVARVTLQRRMLTAG